jgi:hypothetical protein
MPEVPASPLFYSWMRIECELEEFVTDLRAAAQSARYNGSELEQVVKVDVAVDVCIDTVTKLLAELGVLPRESEWIQLELA